MALGTAPLRLGLSALGASSCIRYELTGAYGSYGLLQAITASGEPYNSMLDFENYSSATPITPTKCIINVSTSVIRAIWFCNAANDACQIRYRINSGGWTTFQDATSPYTITLNCQSNTLYEAEIRGRIGTTYSAVCSPSYTSNSTCT